MCNMGNYMLLDNTTLGMLTFTVLQKLIIIRIRSKFISSKLYTHSIIIYQYIIIRYKILPYTERIMETLTKTY